MSQEPHTYKLHTQQTFTQGCTGQTQATTTPENCITNVNQHTCLLKDISRVVFVRGRLHKIGVSQVGVGNVHIDGVPVNLHREHLRGKPSIHPLHIGRINPPPSDRQNQSTSFR
eukprot:3788453-Pyramimonas_sp.AAC.1